MKAGFVLFLPLVTAHLHVDWQSQASRRPLCIVRSMCTYANLAFLLVRPSVTGHWHISSQTLWFRTCCVSECDDDPKEYGLQHCTSPEYMTRGTTFTSVATPVLPQLRVCGRFCTRCDIILICSSRACSSHFLICLNAIDLLIVYFCACL